MIIALYRLLEKNRKTVNFNQLIFLLGKNKKYSKRDIANFRRRMDTLKPYWIKVSKIRNKVFGHETNDMKINPWKSAKLKPNDMKYMIRKYQELINVISQKWNRNTYLFNLSANYDVCNLLKDLREFNLTNFSKKKYNENI